MFHYFVSFFFFLHIYRYKSIACLKRNQSFQWKWMILVRRQKKNAPNGNSQDEKTVSIALQLEFQMHIFHKKTLAVLFFLLFMHNSSKCECLTVTQQTICNVMENIILFFLCYLRIINANRDAIHPNKLSKTKKKLLYQAFELKIIPNYYWMFLLNDVHEYLLWNQRQKGTVKLYWLFI